MVNKTNFLKVTSTENKQEDCITFEELCQIVELPKIRNTALDVSKIKVLDLSHNQLKVLPKCLNKLSLYELNLSFNNFTIIPSGLYGNFKELTTLDLSHNKLRNFDIPPGCVRCLRVLKLNNNSFKNLPKWVLELHCTNLVELDYSNNWATHYDCNVHGYSFKLAKLQKLVLTSSCLLDKDYGYLKSIATLKHLNLSNEPNNKINKFADLDDLFVTPKWRYLNILVLNNLNLSIFPQGILWLEHLVELYVTKNCISWLPEGFQYLVELQILDISNNDLIVLTEELTTLPKLRILNASYNLLDKAPNLTCLPSLEELDLYYNLITDFSHFKINNLKSIDLEQNYFDTSNLEGYKEKRDFFRQKYPLRSTGCRISKRIFDMDDGHIISLSNSLRRESDEESSNSEHDDNEIHYQDYVMEENWDDPVEIKINPEISSSDNEWHGDEGYPRKKRTEKAEKTYVLDEDWMFSDYPEDS